jgi:hypothetical protein
MALVMKEMTGPTLFLQIWNSPNNLPPPTCRGHARQQNKHRNVSCNFPFSVQPHSLC